MEDWVTGVKGSLVRNGSSCLAEDYKIRMTKTKMGKTVES